MSILLSHVTILEVQHNAWHVENAKVWEGWINEKQVKIWKSWEQEREHIWFRVHIGEEINELSRSGRSRSGRPLKAIVHRMHTFYDLMEKQAGAQRTILAGYRAVSTSASEFLSPPYSRSLKGSVPKYQVFISFFNC